ncbi:LysR family transcriptional regulator ArgP [Labedella endophytica]|uniref:LysR family transcriptional regulator ArgP n=1 Tax=Labedella endophytica TaxID=1523160 RepID=A0A3S1CRW6_9MICO|nr:LysR family transcriptional regulator ArgP [Labedella endophytica]RUR00848.1 LysR family transcriptional regulator ArgP [Labedella endophytica]
MDLDLGQLSALAAVVDTGSFDAAARELRVTPSAVSQRIKSLERSAGAVLVRRSRPTTATEAGASYVRLARQITALGRETEDIVSPGRSGLPSVSLAVNGDSLATWVLPALAPLAHRVTFDLHREDQDHSADLLRDGRVMAAITTDAIAVQGCSVALLGTMRYRAMASPAFASVFFADGVTPLALDRAPMLVFDRRDELQDRYLRATAATAAPPRHYLPSSADFAHAVALGIGWAMLPDGQSIDAEDRGELVDLDPGRSIDVLLHWQQWEIATRALDDTARALAAAARAHLDQPRGA